MFHNCRSIVLSATLLISASLGVASVAAFGEHRMISIGDRRLSIDCVGEVGSATVVLIAGGGRTAKDWTKIQPAVSNFARVCSYDFAGFGESDKADSKMQSADEVVNDLHGLLKASGEKGPFILVSHSNSGLYARRFVRRYPREAAGLVFVDSAHEEQALRLHELDPQGPGLDDVTARLGFYVKPGERLEWRTDETLSRSKADSTDCRTSQKPFPVANRRVCKRYRRN